jgi:hypothetical protein
LKVAVQGLDFMIHLFYIHTYMHTIHTYLIRTVVNCRACELAIPLWLVVVTICKYSINPNTNSNPVYSHYIISSYYIPFSSLGSFLLSWRWILQFQQNVGTYLPDFTVSHSRRLWGYNSCKDCTTLWHPCGSLFLHVENSPASETLNFLSVRKEAISLMRLVENPNSDSL